MRRFSRFFAILRIEVWLSLTDCFNALIITLNGTGKELNAGTTLEQLVEQLSAQAPLTMGQIAIEVNGALVRRARYPEFGLKTDDIVEIVTFVGGG